MEQLYIVHAEARRSWGGVEYKIPSRFIDEIDEKLIKHVDRYNSAFSDTDEEEYKDEPTYIPSTEYIQEVSSEPLYDIDQIVMHPKFGRGKIISMSGKGDNAFVTVLFERSGSRQFAASLAPLEVLDNF